MVKIGVGGEKGAHSLKDLSSKPGADSVGQLAGDAARENRQLPRADAARRLQQPGTEGVTTLVSVGRFRIPPFWARKGRNGRHVWVTRD